MLTLYTRIANIAKAVVRYYESDIAVHDKGTLASLQPGDTVLWACRQSGSHLARLDLADREISPLKRRAAMLANRDLFRSANKHWPGMQWYLLTVIDHDGHGTCVKVSIKRVERLYEERLSSAAAPAQSVSDPDRTE